MAYMPSTKEGYTVPLDVKDQEVDRHPADGYQAP